MDAIEAQSILTAALESAGELRATVVDDPTVPIDVRRFAAIVSVAASATDDAGRKALSGTIPSKASLDIGDVDLLVLLLGELLGDAARQAKAAVATKAHLVLPDDIFSVDHTAAADNLRWVLAAEERAIEAAKAASEDREWLDKWIAHGQRRLDKIKAMAREKVVLP